MTNNPLPPVTQSLITRIGEYESRTKRAILQSSGERVNRDLNKAKAIEALRSCVVAVFDLKIKYYAELTNYNPGWIKEITKTTVETSAGLLVGYATPAIREEISKELYATLEDHSASLSTSAPTRDTEEPIPSKDVDPIGKQLTNLRNECNLTQEVLAEKLGLSLRSVQRHESGKDNPRKRCLLLYEKLFSVKLKRDVRIKIPAGIKLY